MRKMFSNLKTLAALGLVILVFVCGCSSLSISSEEDQSKTEAAQTIDAQKAETEQAAAPAPEEKPAVAPAPQLPPEPVDPQTLPQSEKLKLAEAILDNLLQSMEDGNYKRYVKDFTQGLKDNVTEKDFKYRNEKMNDEIGKFKSKEALGVLNKKLFDVFLWKAKFSKHDDEQLIRLFLVSDEKKYKVYMFNISPF